MFFVGLPFGVINRNSNMYSRFDISTRRPAMGTISADFCVDIDRALFLLQRGQTYGQTDGTICVGYRWRC